MDEPYSFPVQDPRSDGGEVAVGRRVRLSVFEESPEETGTVEAIQEHQGLMTMVIVYLDAEYRDPDPMVRDDGYRECTVDQIAEVLG